MPVPLEVPIVVAPSPTPFGRDDSVDFGAIERNVERWLPTPLSGFVLNSENGEEAFLSGRERLEIVRTVCRVCAGRKLVIGGIDNPSVTETMRTADALAEAGAEMVRIRIPRLTTNVRQYFEQFVSRLSVPALIIHQPAPGTFLSGPMSLAVSAEQIGAIVAMDNVFGYIMSADVRLESRVRTLVPAHRQFWASNGSLLLPGAAIGANGACLMLGNVAPQQCRDVLQLMMQGKLNEAQTVQTRLLEADWQILSRGVAGLKAALNLLGFEAGIPRRPVSACSAVQVELIERALRRAGLLG